MKIKIPIRFIDDTPFYDEEMRKLSVKAAQDPDNLRLREVFRVYANALATYKQEIAGLRESLRGVAPVGEALDRLLDPETHPALAATMALNARKRNTNRAFDWSAVGGEVERLVVIYLSGRGWQTAQWLHQTLLDRTPEYQEMVRNGATAMGLGRFLTRFTTPGSEMQKRTRNGAYQYLLELRAGREVQPDPEIEVPPVVTEVSSSPHYANVGFGNPESFEDELGVLSKPEPEESAPRQPRAETPKQNRPEIEIPEPVFVPVIHEPIRHTPESLVLPTAGPAC